MMRLRASNVRALRLASLGLILSVLLSGCFNPFSPKVAKGIGVTEIAPSPNTPRGVLDLFAWCWNNRAYNEYTELFTEDFEFRFAATDSAGNAYRDRALYRQDELDTSRHLFIEGTANEPPASKIVLTFDRTFIPERDSRPGKTYPWHQEIKRNVVLSIDSGDQAFRITGAARFFVVRGDSALLPDELIQRGFTQDPNRWYIERWEDETIESASLVAGIGEEQYRAALAEALARDGTRKAPAEAGALNSLPRDVTWGFMKHVYRIGN
jgi:hypothetical protein